MVGNTIPDDIKALQEWLRGKFEAQSVLLTSIRERLEKIDGTVVEHTNGIHQLETRVVRAETQLTMTQQTARDESTRVTKEQDRQDVKIGDLAQKYGTITLSILLLLDMLGNWLGWW